MIDAHFVILGFVLGIFGDLIYALHTIQGKTQPNRVSWVLWSLAPLIAFAAELNKGVGLQSLMTFAVGFGPALVVAASFMNKKSIWQLTRFDYICGILSLLGLLLWLVTREGNVAIIFSILADGLAALPTIVKSFKDPDSESWSAFFFGVFNAGITLLTIKHWTFAVYGFPVYILVVCLLLTVLIRFKIGLLFYKKQPVLKG